MSQPIRQAKNATQSIICWGAVLPGGRNGQRNSDITSRTTRNNNKRRSTENEKFRNNKTDTRKVQVTPQALLPKRTRQAYLTQNMELMRASSTLIDEHIVETYGNAMKQKQHDNIRLIGQNIGCLGVRSFGKSKTRTREKLAHTK